MEACPQIFRLLCASTYFLWKWRFAKVLVTRNIGHIGIPVLLDLPGWKLSYTLRITASHITRATLLTAEFGANMHAPNSEPDTEKVPCI
jgi:hypothetical protein